MRVHHSKTWFFLSIETDEDRTALEPIAARHGKVIRKISIYDEDLEGLLYQLEDKKEFGQAINAMYSLCGFSEAYSYYLERAGLVPATRAGMQFKLEYGVN